MATPTQSLLINPKTIFIDRHLYIPLLSFTSLYLTLLLLCNFSYKYLILVTLLAMFYFPLLLRINSCTFFSVFGLNTKNLKPALKHLLPVTLIVALADLWLLYFRPDIFYLPQHVDNPPSDLVFSSLIYAGVSAPIQEFIFRGYLLKRFSDFSLHPVFSVLVSALLFSLIHLPLHNLHLMVGTFLVAIPWAVNSIKYNTIYPSIISHAFLGFITVRLPLFLSTYASSLA